MHILSLEIQSDLFPTKNCYPFNLPLLSENQIIQFTTPVSFFCGENGSGKTTVLKALAQQCGAYCWDADTTRFENNKFENHLQQYIQVKWKNKSVPASYFASRSFDYFSKLVDQWSASDPGLLTYFGGKSLVAQSHGQSLMSFFKSRYDIEGIYFIDEPETALSPKTQLELLNLLSVYQKNNKVQFIISTHSPILLSLKGSLIYSFDSNFIQLVSYKETNHYRLYNEFMKNQ